MTDAAHGAPLALSGIRVVAFELAAWKEEA